MRRLAFLLLCWPLWMSAQDTVRVNELDFLRQLLRLHPQLGIQQLDVQIAMAERMGARAAFDPMIKGDYAAKTFDGKSYYDYRQAALEWQFAPGIRVKTGFDRSIGTYINPETFTPESGLVFTELSIPVLDGLLRTPEQTYLRQTELRTEQEARGLELARRDLVQFGAEVYWNWVAMQNELLLREDIVNLAQERYKQVVGQFRLGAATAMDTLEAENQYVKRLTELAEARIAFQDWYNIAGTLLWDDVLFNQFSRQQLAPDTSWSSTSSLHIAQALNDDFTWLHPAVEMIAFKRQEAQLELMLARERLKPDLDISIKAISAADQITINGNNGVVGLSAKVPILSRKERAGIRKSEFKIEQTDLYLEMKLRELQQKRNALVNQMALVNEMYGFAQQNATNARRLLDLEGSKLRLGESTLFIINRRENAYLEAALKEIDSIRKKRILEWKMLLLTYEPAALIG
ncbi:MAG: hypothetical protein RL226_75, partial [Bacteroidota bacterium]